MTAHPTIEREITSSRTQRTSHPIERRTRKASKTTPAAAASIDPMRLEAEREAATFPFHNDKGE